MYWPHNLQQACMDYPTNLDNLQLAMYRLYNLQLAMYRLYNLQLAMYRLYNLQLAMYRYTAYTGQCTDT